MGLSAASRASLKAKILLGVEEAPKDDEELDPGLGRLALRRPPWCCEILTRRTMYWMMTLYNGCKAAHPST